MPVSGVVAIAGLKLLQEPDQPDRAELPQESIDTSTANLGQSEFLGIHRQLAS
jgi:hypothetical protein